MGFWCGVVKILGMHLFVKMMVAFWMEIWMFFCVVVGGCLMVVALGYGFDLVLGIFLRLWFSRSGSFCCGCS